MNYRHIYHAGNFADVMKHALLIKLIQAMQRKDKPFLLLDTHAGIGTYDVLSDEAQRTGEWREGIGKLLGAAPEALAEYVALVEQLGIYPGSPAIAAALLRPQDRLIACELHPEDAAQLRRNMRSKNAAVHERDGYEALTAFLPPPEKRALVLIDPPFERTDEFAQLTKTLLSAWQKFKSGVYVAWYPIKHRAPVRAFFEGLRFTPLRDVIAVEFLRRPDTNPIGLNGNGLLIINPPYGFEADAGPILAACAASFGEPGCAVMVERLINE
jgi:23S rRNA (adenine2030-N6)-methyltransferase